jgi:hypothetical protein
MSEMTEIIDGLTGELELFREMHAETLIAHSDICNRLAARIRELETVLRRVDAALDQTSAVLWKSLKAEVKATLGSQTETKGEQNGN